ncbi:MAG: phage portal protein [Desulfotalea sp.]
MEKKNKKQKEATKGGAMAFKFGDPEPILSRNLTDYTGVILLDNGSYYSTPVSLSGLAKLRGANAYHGPLLEFKVNMAIKDAIFSTVLPRKELLPWFTDFVTFTNGYFQKICNRFGDIIYLKHLPAMLMRRLKGIDCYCMLQSNGNRVDFQPGEVIHIKNYDVAQSIYGIPSYLGAIQSMLLNEDSTLFRRRYYLNGAHVGYIFYSSGANLDDNDQAAIKEQVQKTKNLGNFQNMFLHIPNGREKDVQILPVGDFSTRDELEKIKNLTRDDIIAAHRITPALANVIPDKGSSGGFGDIVKASEVYMENEIKPLRGYALEINDLLTKNRHLVFENV